MGVASARTSIIKVSLTERRHSDSEMFPGVSV